ncbi:Rossmann-like and DUF2520 domain-containing protein [Winogradskyella jejuensis]|uniref:Predicted oxidoreductase, contains short-chain dehydrogenase (SDR) and DUF2520 domains n=1 Tax=Winogradskyella jejuensis TaxID=1089305 RepID=A0A1M5V042_9FLAO|nr:DUF2520 domain-containing protein [Winogradskyella jejuensis]SHH68622.1 Predicted oxidoreductase, contains short-chain dehydrogenase (SDR) and DUF2520 domains [Winogradskyella jejuensis]
MISVILIGAGNVASHLYRAFLNAESVVVKQWYNRSFEAIKSYKNDTEVINDLSQLKEADVYIMAVSDDAVASLSKTLPFTNRFVVHTSGSVSLHDLDKKNTRGVFYPLQSFSKEAEMDFSNVPICIETEEKTKLQMLKDLAEAIDSKPYKISTEQRQTLHLSAVFVNNFSNQMYRIAHEISDAKHINFDILKPLILETANKVQEMSPYMSQTGPAKRNDKKTLKRHIKLLENEEHRDIYELLTQSIQKTHGIKYKFNSKKKN